MEWLNDLVKKGYYKTNYEPCKCIRCGEDQFEHMNFSILNGVVCEYDIFCKKCGKLAASWAMGNYFIL
jgi:hypothetical protein